MSAASYRPCHRALVVLVVLALLASALVVFPATVVATNYVVTECGDAGGANTLRGRLEAANGDANAPHLITFSFAAACPAITLNGAQLDLTRDMTIQGPGAGDLTVSGGGDSRVIFVADGVTATISGLTIADGDAGNEDGGGIDNTGTLTITGSTISGNSSNFGGGIANTSNGTLEITGSTISGNSSTLGGGIYNSVGTLAVTNSTLSGNSAFAGGGINNFGTLMVTNSTLSGNTADYGGGISNFAGTLAVTNSTLSGNSAIAGGGIYNVSGTTTLEGTLLAGNPSGGNCNGSMSSLGYNLSDDTTCALADTGDLDNNGSANLDPTLANNGGPTETHALLSGSVAIDHIPAAQCAVLFDQRGVLRPQNEACDIGASEVYVENNYQACLFAGALSQVSGIGSNTVPNPGLNCGRGTAIVIADGADTDIRRSFACLYAGSLSQVGPIFGDPPSNCGRGTLIVLASGDELFGCLFAGRLSQVGYSEPVSCGRGEPVQLGLAEYQNGG